MEKKLNCFISIKYTIFVLHLILYFKITQMRSLENFSKIKVTTLAGYILKYFGPMSHLKLQKLLYSVQEQDRLLLIPFM